MQTYLNELLPSIQSLGLWGYWLIGLMAFGEALVLTSIFAPGSVVVVLGGALVAQGLYDFWIMICFVATGTILGAEISFRIGATGASLFQEGRRVFSPAHLERGKRFFEKYGAPSIILGHFFGPLRPIIPVVAGLSNMSRRRFFLWNVIGGFTYAVALVSVGYFFGTATNLFSATMTRAGLFAIAVLLAIALMWFAAVKLRKALPFFISVFRSVGLAISDNPDVRALVERHPILFRFLSERLSRDSFAGLPSTILASTFVYFLFLYAGSTLDFVRQSQIVAADVRVASLLTAFRDPALVRFFTVFTALGSWKAIAILAITVSAVLLLQRRLHYLPSLWLVLIGNQLTVTLLKNVFARPRPDMAVFAESGFLIFLGTASFDDGLKWGMTHRIDPNIDAERDLLATDLQNTGLIISEQHIQLVAPILGQNLTGDPFFTDGKAIVFQLESDRNVITVQPGPEVQSPRNPSLQ